MLVNHIKIFAKNEIKIKDFSSNNLNLQQRYWKGTWDWKMDHAEALVLELLSQYGKVS